jgi:membrane protease YdiL (CAAX protease family)
MKGGGAVIDAPAARHYLDLALRAAILLGLFCTVLFVARRGWAALLPRPLRDRFVRWGFAEIILAFVVLVAGPILMYRVLSACGLFRYLFGRDPDPTDLQSGPTLRCLIAWVSTLALPVNIIGALALVRFVSGTRLQHLGIRLRRVLPGIAAGFIGWLLLTPAVFGLHIGVVALQERLLHWPPTKHPLEQLLEVDLLPVEWLLVVLQAVVLAPIWEELLFRGLLLPRLAKHAWGGHAAWAAASVLAGMQLDRQMTLPSLLPLLFALALWIAGDLATAGETGPYWKWRAILGSSALFALIHSSAWPAPVPLFPLAVALGWLAYRTRGIIAPIVLHALFNSVSTLLLLRGFHSTV